MPKKSTLAGPPRPMKFGARARILGDLLKNQTANTKLSLLRVYLLSYLSGQRDNRMLHK